MAGKQKRRADDAATRSGVDTGDRAATSRTCILVLGMHRSGTSALTRVLSLMGCALPRQLLVADPTNETGHWEPLQLVLLHERMLAEAGSRWDDWRTFDMAALPTERMRYYRDEIARILHEEYGDAPIIVVKDPRICRFVSFFSEAALSAGYEVRSVVMFRNPLEVCESLERRNGMAREQAALLWLRHVLDAERESRNAPRAIVDYDSLLSDWRGCLADLDSDLGIDWPVAIDKAAAQIDAFLAPEMRHHNHSAEALLLDPLLQGWIANALDVLTELARIADTSDGHAKLDAIHDGFENASPLLSGIQTHLNRVRGELQNVLTQRASEVDAISSRSNVRIAALQLEARRAKARMASLRRALSNVYESNSWKITAPARRLKQASTSCLPALHRVYRSLRLPLFLRRSLHRSLLVLSPRLYRAVIDLARKDTDGSPSGGFEDRRSQDMNMSMEHPPLFSVIIPIHDRTDLLREAIESVLRQSFRDLELILITDGSPPSTMSVVESYGALPNVRIFSFPKSSGNAVRGRNKGILEARGKYVSFLDSDDLATTDRLQITKDVFEKENCDVVYGAWRAILDGSRQVDGLVDGQLIVSPQCGVSELKETCVPCQSTVSVRKRVLDEFGYLKPRMQYREDHELWLRLAHFGARFRPTTSQLASLRLHSGNNELNFKPDDAHWKQLLESEYDRRGPRPRKIVYLVGNLNPSGGLLMVVRHAEIFMSFGHDVTIFNLAESGNLRDWLPACDVPVINFNEHTPDYHLSNIDLCIATYWMTVEVARELDAARKAYLVQSDERLFYTDASDKQRVAGTYWGDFDFIVVSEWIGNFLQREFGRNDWKLVPNGIDTKLFNNAVPRRNRDVFRVLIEGPLSVSWKGVADAYHAVADLPVEIWMVTSDIAPPDDWRVSKWFKSVDQATMAEIYNSCDVLVKLSRMESYCLPAMEAMACGCAVVIGAVDGEIEYLRPGENCILVDRGSRTQAKEAVERLKADRELLDRLVAGGLETAAGYSLHRTRDALADLMEEWLA
ncbi:MAG: glycosyltransferase [Nitratireductor sp.]|nr:glycosyltransferase [Nitratireductor sp.]